MVQPWVPPSILLWPPSSWNNLKSRPSLLPPTPQGYDSGMWMTPFSSKRQNTTIDYYNTSTPLSLTYNLLQNPNTDGSIPFLETSVSPVPENTLLTTVYRKPTHTDQYLHWDNHHYLSAKYSEFNTLTHRARTVCVNPQLLHKEE